MTTRTPALYERYPVLASSAFEIDAALDVLVAAFGAQNKLLICGNGGSASDSEHIVGELMKSFCRRRPIASELADKLRVIGGEEGADTAAKLEGALPAVALTSQVALSTAVANDIGGEMVFAQQVYGLGRPGDVLLGISTSGNSRNVIRAFMVARACGLKTIALTGRSGGRLKALADVAVCVAADRVAEIQELHLPIYHAWCVAVEEHFFS